MSSPERSGDLDIRGNRIAPDDVLPPWMRPLVQSLGSLSLPSRLAWTGQPLPSGSRPSAVLILLADGPDGPDVLLTGRATTMRSHAGQPAFPGGRLDPGEDAVTAAVREAWEETGLDPASVTPAGLFPQAYLFPSRSIVRPVLAYWHTPGPVRAVDPAEIAAVARVPIAALTDPANRGRIRHPSGFTGPAFAVADLLVWGFTAGLLEVLLDLGGWTRPWNRDQFFELDLR